MRRLLWVMSILLLTATWATAQVGDTVGGAYQGGKEAVEKSAEKSKEAVTSLADNNMTVQGCLTKVGGGYQLSDRSSGTDYALTGNTSQLASHVGHTVQVTGTKSSEKAPGAMAGEPGSMKQTLKVSSFKHVSNSCSP